MSHILDLSDCSRLNRSCFNTSFENTRLGWHHIRKFQLNCTRSSHLVKVETPDAATERCPFPFVINMPSGEWDSETIWISYSPTTLYLKTSASTSVPWGRSIATHETLNSLTVGALSAGTLGAVSPWCTAGPLRICTEWAGLPSVLVPSAFTPFTPTGCTAPQPLLSAGRCPVQRLLLSKILGPNSHLQHPLKFQVLPPWFFLHKPGNFHHSQTYSPSLCLCYYSARKPSPSIQVLPFLQSLVQSLPLP